MTILLLISSEGHYGIENMLLVLARSLSALGCRCVIGVFRDSRSPHLEVAEEAQKHGLKAEIISCRGRADWSAVTQICELLAKYEVDILHPHGYKADLYAYAAALLRGVPILATSHNWPSKKLYMRFYAALDRLALRRFDRVVAVSGPVRNTLLHSRIDSTKIRLIPNGVEIKTYSDAFPTLATKNSEPNRVLVGFVGRLIPDKGGALFLNAAQKVIAVRPDTDFVLVGDGPSKNEWQALAKQLGIADHVVFAGNRNDMPGVYASLDMLVLPSLVESMPMCLLEAMAAGKPVIATRVGGIPGVVVSGETGLLVDAGEVGQLANAILNLRESAELRRRLGENARLQVSEEFSAETMTRSYLTQYQDILARRGVQTTHPSENRDAGENQVDTREACRLL